MSQKMKFEKAFAMADSDGSGAIETDEIADFIMDLLPEYNFQEDDILAVFENFDHGKGFLV